MMKTSETGYLTCFVMLLINGMLQTAETVEPNSSQSQRPIEIISNSINMKLALIPPGKFVMGSPRDEQEREPEEIAHEVIISKSFYMGVYEVTQREFSKITLPGENRRPPRPNFTSARGGGPDHPIENLLWKDSIDFCKALSKQPAERQAGRTYRLPTEAEWEYACRAGSQTAFHFGNSLSSKQANFNGNYPFGSAPKGSYMRKTAKVGSYEPNAFGLYDMHGNVSEYCADWYDKEYYRDSPLDDPLGPPVGVLETGYGNHFMIVRGGCWVDDARACRAAYRFRAMPRNTYRLIGFRVVCDVEEQD
jgi:formylglycine-generating enzyme required for sulfatase activity